MLSDNLVMLRNSYGYSQEKIAEEIGISRQAYAKWESGATIPDIEKCARLAELFGISLDSLIKTETADGIGMVRPCPKGKNIWGTVTINERGQIVIPKGARDRFNLTGGTRIVVLSDETGIALLPAILFEERMRAAMEFAEMQNNE